MRRRHVDSICFFTLGVEGLWQTLACLLSFLFPAPRSLNPKHSRNGDVLIKNRGVRLVHMHKPGAARRSISTRKCVDGVWMEACVRGPRRLEVRKPTGSGQAMEEKSLH